VGEQIAGFKKPRQVVFTEELPHVNNEIDREAVKAKWGSIIDKITPGLRKPK
jgi:hypothetical protein